MMLRGDSKQKVDLILFQGSNVPDEDIRYAGDKFKESLELASDGMANLLDNEVNLT